MIEDKLTRDERLRLECLAQAIHLNTMGGSKQALPIVRQASEFEEYVRFGFERNAK